jgi:membrane associated rhomboid family serine protease
VILIPTGTDAPLYHYPISTIGLVAINVFAYALGVAGYFLPEQYILSFGDGFHPTQWVTSVFLHQGIFHLLSNMTFLLAFGLIVEGKIGWWKFLGLYLLLGIIESFGSQTLMFFSEGGGALGASGAIMGILAVGVIWAPNNNITFGFIFYFSLYQFEVSLLSVGFFFFASNLLVLTFNQFQMSSELLHLLGLLPGLVIGIVFIRFKWVDCEGCDILSQNFGGGWLDEVLSGASWKGPPQETDGDVEERLKQMREEVRDFLKSGQTKEANDLFLKICVEDNQAKWSEDEILTIVQQFRSQGQVDECIPFLKEYLTRFQSRAVEVRLLLAEHSLHCERPSEALITLKPILNIPLAQPLHLRREAIIKKANELASDVLEIRHDD